mgnify:CR=1 FL=1
MDPNLILESCERAQGLRLVDSRRASAIARLYPYMAFTTTREYMEAPCLRHANAAAEATLLGMRPYLISDEALLLNVEPFVPVLSVGVEPVRIPRKWRHPDEFLPVMAPAGSLLVPLTALLAWL